MGQLKPWQLVLIIVALLVLGGSIAFQMLGGKKVDFADSIMLVDVTTGDRYVFDTSGPRGIILPGRHPETRKRVLMPIVEDDSGAWKVVDRYRSDLEDVEGELVAVDSTSLAVRVSDADPKKLN